MVYFYWVATPELHSSESLKTSNFQVKHRFSVEYNSILGQFIPFYFFAKVDLQLE